MISRGRRTGIERAVIRVHASTLIPLNGEVELFGSLV
jgi:hypothetical protein